MKIKPGEYEIRLLNNPGQENVIRFGIVSKEARDSKGNALFKKLSREKVYTIKKNPKVVLLPIPKNPKRLLVVTKDFYQPRMLLLE